MSRLACRHKIFADSGLRLMYGRMLAMWASDQLTTKTPIAWRCDEDPQGDYRDHDWRCLYQGSVLDD